MGSEMCIRDSFEKAKKRPLCNDKTTISPVQYTDEEIENFNWEDRCCMSVIKDLKAS